MEEGRKPENEQIKYWAFISYSQRDGKWGKWLFRALEHYRAPWGLRGRPSRDGTVPKRLYPIFRDREELPGSSDLGDNLNSALRRSRYLVVICSPNAAKSFWVNQEIRYFKSHVGEDRVLCFIIDGEPNASEKEGDKSLECFPEAVRYRVNAAGEVTDDRTEPIAADARRHGDGKRNAKIKLLAGLLGVNYDDLKRREKWRIIRRRITQGALAAAAIAIGVWYWLQPGYVKIQMRPNPPGLAVTIDGRPVESSDLDDREIPVSPGSHVFQFAAPNYMDKKLEVTVTRLQHWGMVAEMVHEKGQLNAEAGPTGETDPQIQVDGNVVGPLIDQLAIDTGEHQVSALMPGRYERAQRVTTRRGESQSLYLSLDPAKTAWEIKLPSVQEGFANLGDVDGDGIEDFAHNFTDRIEIISGATGKVLHTYPTLDGYNRPFSGADLGPKVGRVALSSGTGNVVAPDGSHLTDVVCISGDPAKPFPLWVWQNPAPPRDNASATVVPDQNGDGVSDLVVTSVADEFYLVDGAAGSTIRNLNSGVGQWVTPPQVRLCTTKDGDGLLVLGRRPGANADESALKQTYHAGLISLKSGQLVWEKDLPGLTGIYITQVIGMHQPVLAMVDETDWKICSGATGQIIYQGKLPRADKNAALKCFAFANVNGVPYWIMLFPPSSVPSDPKVAAVRISDGTVAWHRDDLLPISDQLYEGDVLARSDDGGLFLRTDEALYCLDPSQKGAILWRHPVDSVPTLRLLRDSTGKRLLFVPERHKIFHCFDLGGAPLWGAWLENSPEFAPVLMLADSHAGGRSRLILGRHFGRGETNEIACLPVPLDGYWERRVIPPNAPAGSSGASDPRSAHVGPHGVVADLTAAARTQPNGLCFDAETGAMLWTAPELFESAFGRFGAAPGIENWEAPPAYGKWGGVDAFALTGYHPPSSGQTSVFVYRAIDGLNLADIPIEPTTVSYAASLMEDVDGDGKTDVVVARPALRDMNRGGFMNSGDVVAVGGAQQKQIWRKEMDQPCALAIARLPNEKKARVIVTLNNGTLCALDGSDGTQIWTLGGDVIGPAAEVDIGGQPALIVVGKQGAVRVVDPVTGKVTRSAILNGIADLHGPVVAADSILMIACGNAGLIALDAQTLNEKWRLSRPVSVPPAMVNIAGEADTQAVVCTDSANVLLVNPKTGGIVWSGLLDGASTDGTAAPYGQIAVLPAENGRSARLMVTCKDGILRSLPITGRDH